VDHRQPGALADLERAAQAYRQAKLLAPFYSALASNLVEVSLWKGRAMGLGTPQAGEALAEGEALFQDGVKRFPQVAFLWLRGAQLAETQGQTQDAKARIRRAFALNPHNPEIRLLLKALQQKG
jgi:tetratricopeptide (TPR) repeat protein